VIPDCQKWAASGKDEYKGLIDDGNDNIGELKKKNDTAAGGADLSQ
jgi:hypothetical protein